MSKSVVTLAPNMGTDAGFRAIIQLIHDSFLLAGYTQKADTGQLNIATATRAHDTISGHILYEQDGIVLKVEYGTTANSTTFTLYITAGTGSDGSGVLTGQFTNRIGGLPHTTGTTPYECRISYSVAEKYVAMALWHLSVTAGNRYLIVVERNRTETFEVDTGAGKGVSILIGRGDGNTFGFFRCGAGTIAEGAGPVINNPCISHPLLATLVINAKTSALHILPWVGKYLNPMISVVAYEGADYSAGNTFTMTLNGVTRTFLVTHAFGWLNRFWASCRAAILWED